MKNNESRNKEDLFYPLEDASLYFGSIDKEFRSNTLIDEELFLQQKAEIIKAKKKNDKFKNKISKQTSAEYSNFRLTTTNTNNNKNNNNKIYPTKIFNGVFHYLTLNDYNFFESTDFFCDISGNENNYFPSLDTTWSNEKQLKLYGNKLKYIQLRNLALRTVNEVNYDINGIEINMNFNLKGENQLWIFTRSFVNKDINESIIFDKESSHINSIDIFNKYTTLIRISKEANCNKCYISFGTFYEDKIFEKVFCKFFYKRQLIDFSYDINNNVENNYYYIENDICEFHLILLDLGNEIIKTKISVNGSKKTNDSKADFYLPLNKRAKILFCGAGQGVNIKDLIINCFNKENENNGFFTSEQKTCNCCSII